MYLKRLSILAALAISATTLVATPANSASIAGTACPKVSATKTVSNIKYTCVKSGKKLVWNKGVKAPAATPTPAPTKSPEAVPTPTPTPTPTFVPPTAPTSFDNLIENYKGIAYAAWSKSRAKIESSNAIASTIVMHQGANSVIPNKNPQIAYDLTARLYDGFAMPKKTDILAFGWADRDWAVSKMDELMPSAGSRWIKDMACATKETCWGGGAFSDGKGNYLLVITTEVIDDNHTSGTLEVHEYTHIIQQSQMTKSQPWPPTTDWPSSWYLEGHAEFSQNAAIFNKSYDEYLKNRYAVSQNLFKNPSYDSAFFEKYFVVTPPQSWFQEHDRWLQYDAGGMLIEILTALKGPDSTMELWRKMGNGVSFYDAFKQIWDYDFDKALPIIAKAIALEVGKK